MFKKFFLIGLLFLGTFVFADDEDSKESKYIPTAYSIRCYKCDQYNERHPGYGNAGGIAERRFELEAKSKLKHTFIYHCPYGHILYIDTETGERK